MGIEKAYGDYLAIRYPKQTVKVTLKRAWNEEKFRRVLHIEVLGEHLRQDKCFHLIVDFNELSHPLTKSLLISLLRVVSNIEGVDRLTLVTRPNDDETNAGKLANSIARFSVNVQQQWKLAG